MGKRKVLENQILVFSVNLSTLYGVNNPPSEVQFPINLRFAADTMVVKSIVYQQPTITSNPPAVGDDLPQMVQIWCNIANDDIIGVFSNTNTGQGLYHNESFLIPNPVQISSIKFQFQQVVPTTTTTPISSYGSGPLISETAGGQRTHGVVSMTIEFLRHSKD